MCATLRPFYDLLSLFVNIIGQVITRNSTSGEEVGYMALAGHNSVTMISLVLQMTQSVQAYG